MTFETEDVMLNIFIVVNEYMYIIYVYFLKTLL